MMKFWSVIAVLTMFWALPVQAADNKVSYLEEMYSLGSVCGQGLACKSQKYHQFELLARALVVGKAPNDKMQQEGMQRYNTGKVEAFMALEETNFAECDVILSEFDSQKIFQSVLYSDGKVKLYDGSIITPRKPYDASKLYVKDREAFLKADAAYKKFVAQAKKNGQNAKKIPLYDSRYNSYAE